MVKCFWNTQGSAGMGLLVRKRGMGRPEGEPPLAPPRLLPVLGRVGGGGYVLEIEIIFQACQAGYVGSLRSCPSTVYHRQWAGKAWLLPLLRTESYKEGLNLR